MSEDSTILTRRRRFLTGMGVVATGATLAATARSAEHHGGTGFTPARHELDSWMNEIDGIHRAFVDSSTGAGGANALNYVSNILASHREEYGGRDEDYAMIVCFRHMSTPFGYNDAMWAKYGTVLSRFTGFKTPGGDEPLSVNPMNIQQAVYGNRGNTVDQLGRRGVQFAICNRATRAASGMIARSMNTSAEDVYQELIRNNVASSRFVPAGVLAATRSQEYGYSLLFAAG